MYRLLSTTTSYFLLIFFVIQVSSNEQDEIASTPAASKQSFEENSIFEDFDAPIPFNERSREHIDQILNLNKEIDEEEIRHWDDITQKLFNIYQSSIQPLADAYKFSGIGRKQVTEGAIKSVPRVVLLGPWSTGKSSLINYILNLENSSYALPSGAQPTTTEFTVLQYGPTYKTMEGSVLTMDPAYTTLVKFGQSFLEKLQAIQLPHKLLRRVTLVDTPGIIENRKQQERGYPFYEVCQWLVDNSDLIIVVFDPTKLDVGFELEKLFQQLKGKEAKIRFIMNKADSVTPQELMRVYGALYWSLAPLINVTEPPRMYTSSFWSRHYRSRVNRDLFLHEEISLIQDINEAIDNSLETKIGQIRRYAVMVRNHAILVDSYLATYKANRPLLFGSAEEVLKNILINPEEYKVFQSAKSGDDVLSAITDFYKPEDYKAFFVHQEIHNFKALSSHCSMFSGCYLDHIQKAIDTELPKLIQELTNRRAECVRNGLPCGGLRMNDILQHNKDKYKYKKF